jgi:hypothetical protein
MVTGSGSHEFLAQYIGEGTPTFDTPDNDQLLLPDFDGVYHAIPTDTMPVYGSRVVTNEITVSNNMAGTYYSTNNATVLSASTFQFSTNTGRVSNESLEDYPSRRLVKAGQKIIFRITLSSSAGAGSDIGLRINHRFASTTTALVQLTATPTVYTITREATADDAAYWFEVYASGGSALNTDITATDWQAEIKNSGDIPSEFVATTGVPATKHFTNLNGNTVTNNVVTEAEGAPLQSGVDDPSLVNEIARSSDLSQAGWAETNTSVLYNQKGLTGEPNTATLISATNTTNVRRWFNLTFPTGKTTCRLFVKPATYDGARLEVFNTSVGVPSVRLNMTTGDVTTSGSVDDFSATRLGGGWWEMLLEYTETGPDFTGATRVQIAGGTNTLVIGDSIVAGNVETFFGKTIADIRGKSAMVTEGTTGGTPTQIGQFPSLYAAPAATNLIEWSRDLTQAAWTGSASLDTTYNQVGITGEPNTASLITPNSSGSNRIRTQIKTISAGSAVQRVIVKWDSGVSNWAALSVVGLDTTPLKVWYDVVTGVVGTVTGAVAADIEALGGGWYACYLETASTTLLDGQWSVSPTNNDGVDGGAVGEGRIIGNFEVYSGKTIAQVRGSAPIVTAGASVTNALVTDVFDSLNMSDTQGAIYIEAKMPLANNVLSTFIETVGANYRVNDGTTTATQPWTADTWQKVGIAYGSSQMSINVDGVWSADVAYDGTLLSGALDLFRTPAGADTGRNIQRWDLAYADAQAKITELMT